MTDSHTPEEELADSNEIGGNILIFQIIGILSWLIIIATAIIGSIISLTDWLDKYLHNRIN